MSTSKETDGHALTFRVADPSDIDNLWAMRTRAARVQCAGHYPPQKLDAWLSCPPSDGFRGHLSRGHAIVGEVGTTLVGYTIIDAGAQELEALFVAPEYFRQGYGRELLAEAERLAMALDIEMLSLSAALNAIGFYRAHGYELLEVDEMAHRSGVMLKRGVMRKHLVQTPPLPQR